MQKKSAPEKIRKTLHGQFYDLITPEDGYWDVIQQLQMSGKLPHFLKQVFVYTIPRQYEKHVKEMEHWDILEVRLKIAHSILSISPRYEEIIKKYTCYNPKEGRLHILLKGYESLDDLTDIFQKETVFIPPIFL